MKFPDAFGANFFGSLKDSAPGQGLEILRKRHSDETKKNLLFPVAFLIHPAPFRRP